MAKHVWVYVSKTDERVICRVVEQADARASADAVLGVANWTEYDVTPDARAALQTIVGVSRDRVETRDGTGRWRWRTVDAVLKRWLGEPVDETCASCGQKVTSTV